MKIYGRVNEHGLKVVLSGTDDSVIFRLHPDYREWGEINAGYLFEFIITRDGAIPIFQSKFELFYDDHASIV